jgi:hypothetical protein
LQVTDGHFRLGTLILAHWKIWLRALNHWSLTGNTGRLRALNHWSLTERSRRQRALNHWSLTERSRRQRAIDDGSFAGDASG